MSSVNLTWWVTSLDYYKMTFKLNFKNPIKISPLEEQDRIIVHLKEPSFFFSPELRKDVHPQWWTLESNLKK